MALLTSSDDDISASITCTTSIASRKSFSYILSLSSFCSRSANPPLGLAAAAAEVVVVVVVADDEFLAGFLCSAAGSGYAGDASGWDEGIDGDESGDETLPDIEVRADMKVEAWGAVNDDDVNDPWVGGVDDVGDDDDS